MKKIKFISALLLALLLTNCASVFIPRSQYVTINNNSDQTEVYIKDELKFKGKSKKIKLKKDGIVQIVTKTPGYKDEYSVLVEYRRAYSYYPLMLIGIPLYYFPAVVDMLNVDGTSVYPKTFMTRPNKLKYSIKSENEKFINLEKVDVKLTNKNIETILVDHELEDSQLEANKKSALKKQDESNLKAQKRIEKLKKKGKYVEEKEDKLILADTKFTDELGKTLVKTGYVDTVNTIFYDNNNTLFLSGTIDFARYYHIYPNHGIYFSMELGVKWYIKNYYDEILDSIHIVGSSGYFSSKDGGLHSDAMNNAFIKLQNDSKFQKYLTIDKNLSISEPILELSKSKNIVKSKKDAILASVIVKTKNGHGSGFAVTEDGYIITNYHVVSNAIQSKKDKIEIILGNGNKVEAKLIRSNKYRDLALLKVDSKFEKVFEIKSVKTFETLDEVYTVGAPKSIELGQSISMGIISNERNINNNSLLQLNMAVNFGNSGGPLFDSEGNLDGVIVAKLTGYTTEGVCFAIPGYKIAEYLNLKP